MKRLHCHDFGERSGVMTATRGRRHQQRSLDFLGCAAFTPDDAAGPHHITSQYEKSPVAKGSATRRATAAADAVAAIRFSTMPRP